MNLKKLWNTINEARQIPKITIDLMGERAAVDNDPFFLRVVEDFYKSAKRPHPKLFVVGFLEYGVAVNPFPASHDDWLKSIQGSARRNIKKAIRNGYRFEKINYNDYLADIQEIHRSAPVRQGKMPDELLHGELKPIQNPPSKSNVHDYPYFGVLKGDKLLAYAGCLVAGEMLLNATFFGHDKYKSDGLVPYLFSGIAEYRYKHYPQTVYYVYDTYYGASENLKRFKRKLGFKPYRVIWKL